jgi:plasminogen activator inhibitor 1 RNA-binding protein
MFQEMTLEEYQKIWEEKRKTLEANKSEERKVEVDKAFKSMQLVEKKKEDDVFIKLVNIFHFEFWSNLKYLV